jgi:hypothetical protein
MTTGFVICTTHIDVVKWGYRCLGKEEAGNISGILRGQYLCWSSTGRLNREIGCGMEAAQDNDR